MFGVLSILLCIIHYTLPKLWHPLVMRALFFVHNWVLMKGSWTLAASFVLPSGSDQYLQCEGDTFQRLRGHVAHESGRPLSKQSQSDNLDETVASCSSVPITPSLLPRLSRLRCAIAISRLVGLGRASEQMSCCRLVAQKDDLFPRTL